MASFFTRLSGGHLLRHSSELCPLLGIQELDIPPLPDPSPCGLFRPRIVSQPASGPSASVHVVVPGPNDAVSHKELSSLWDDITAEDQTGMNLGQLPDSHQLGAEADLAIRPSVTIGAFEGAQRLCDADGVIPADGLQLSYGMQSSSAFACQLASLETSQVEKLAGCGTGLQVASGLQRSSHELGRWGSNISGAAFQRSLPGDSIPLSAEQRLGEQQVLEEKLEQLSSRAQRLASRVQELVDCGQNQCVVPCSVEPLPKSQSPAMEQAPPQEPQLPALIPVALQQLEHDLEYSNVGTSLPAAADTSPRRSLLEMTLGSLKNLFSPLSGHLLDLLNLRPPQEPPDNQPPAEAQPLKSLVKEELRTSRQATVSLSGGPAEAVRLQPVIQEKVADLPASTQALEPEPALPHPKRNRQSAVSDCLPQEGPVLLQVKASQPTDTGADFDLVQPVSAETKFAKIQRFKEKKRRRQEAHASGAGLYTRTFRGEGGSGREDEGPTHMATPPSHCSGMGMKEELPAEDDNVEKARRRRHPPLPADEARAHAVVKHRLSAQASNARRKALLARAVGVENLFQPIRALLQTACRGNEQIRAGILSHAEDQERDLMEQFLDPAVDLDDLLCCGAGVGVLPTRHVAMTPGGGHLPTCENSGYVGHEG